MKNNKRVLLISDVTGEGGVDYYVHYLACAAKNSGWDVHIIVEQQRTMSELLNSLSDKDIIVKKDTIYSRYYLENDIIDRIENYLEELKPDLVHVIGGSVRSAIAIRETVIEGNIPLVFTESYVADNLKITLEELKRIKKIYEKADGIIALCQQNIDVLKEVFGLQSNHMHLIPTSVDIEEIIQKSNNEKKDFYRFLCLGRLVKQKGYDILIQAVACLKQRGIYNFDVSIFGEGEDRKELEEMIAENNLEERIKLLGWISRGEKKIAEYDLFLMPSRYEGQPFALIFALAAGIPCIASDASGMKELLCNGLAGGLHKSTDVEKLADAIEDFLQSPDNYLSKTSVATENILANYNVTTNCKRILQIWERVTNA